MLIGSTGRKSIDLISTHGDSSKTRPYGVESQVHLRTESWCVMQLESESVRAIDIRSGGGEGSYEPISDAC